MWAERSNHEGLAFGYKTPAILLSLMQPCHIEVKSIEMILHEDADIFSTSLFYFIFVSCILMQGHDYDYSDIQTDH